MSEPTPKTLACPTCGMPLDLDGDSPLVRCKSCQNITLIDVLKLDRPDKTPGIPEDILSLINAGNKVEAIKNYRERYEVSLERAKTAIDLIEAGQRDETEAGFQVQAETVEAQPVREEKVVKSSARWLGLAIPVVILVIVLGVLAFVLLQPGGPLTQMLEVDRTAIILASNAETSPDIISQFLNTNDETRLIGRINGSTGKLKWKAKPLPDSGSVDAILSEGDLVFVASRENLFAYNSDNGRIAWQVEMPGKLDKGENTLIAKDGYVLTLTVNRSLQAYDAQTGELAWSKALRGLFRGIWPLGDALAYVDYLNEGSDYSLIFINPADGSQASVITPTCQTDQSLEKLESDSGIAYDDAENSLYLVFGLLQGCVQRYSLDNGEMAWQAISEDEGFLLSNYGFNAVIGETSLYFSYENRLFSVEKQTGIMRVVLASYNYALVPLAVSDNVLVTVVRRIHGSESFEIWGLDTSSGESIWQIVPENAKPLEAPFRIVNVIEANNAAWVSHMTPEGLLLLKFQAAPNSLSIETINPMNGTGSGELTVDLADIVEDSYLSPEVIGWQGDVVYFILETRLYGLDVATGQLVLKY